MQPERRKGQHRKPVAGIDFCGHGHSTYESIISCDWIAPIKKRIPPPKAGKRNIANKAREEVIWFFLTSDNPPTFQQLGDIFGISRQRVKQIVQALEKAKGVKLESRTDRNPRRLFERTDQGVGRSNEGLDRVTSWGLFGRRPTGTPPS